MNLVNPNQTKWKDILLWLSTTIGKSINYVNNDEWNSTIHKGLDMSTDLKQRNVSTEFSRNFRWNLARCRLDDENSRKFLHYWCFRMGCRRMMIVRDTQLREISEKIPLAARISMRLVYKISPDLFTNHKNNFNKAEPVLKCYDTEKVVNNFVLSLFTAELQKRAFVPLFHRQSRCELL